MDHTLAVGIGHGLADAQERAECTLLRPPFGLSLSRMDQLEDLLQLPPAHETHGEVHAALIAYPQLVDRQDTRVLQLSRNLCFLQETGQRALIHP